MVHPWEYTDLLAIFQFLFNHNPNGEWRVKARPTSTQPVQGQGHYGPILPQTVIFLPTSIDHLCEIINSEEYRVERINWKGVGLDSVSIYPDSREVEMRTDSISFLAMIRHALYHSSPRKLLVDLKVGP